MYGCRGSFSRHHPIKPVQSTLQVTHGTLGSHSDYGPRFKQLSSSGTSHPISAPPIQSYYNGVIRISLRFNNHASREDNLSVGIQVISGSIVPSFRATCHIMVLVPLFRLIFSPPTQPGRGKSQVARGRGHSVRGGG